MEPQLHFFIGKGGVGKSTSSALVSVYLAETARNVLLVSMDPAHNQRDIFERDFSEKPYPINRHLVVKEVDTDFWIEKYLKEAQNDIKRTYQYESAFNLQNFFNVLQFSPGLEEYALILAFKDIIHRFRERDYIVFDMAPTALTLRFFSLPFITLIWLEELLKLRRMIYDKKEIISKIKVGRKEIEQDKVKVKLEKLINNYEHLRRNFLSDATRINLVMNNDRLSFSEAYRIRGKLGQIGIAIDMVVVNKLSPGEPIDEIENEFREQQLMRLPAATAGLAGYEVLKEFVQANRKNFAHF